MLDMRSARSVQAPAEWLWEPQKKQPMSVWAVEGAKVTFRPFSFPPVGRLGSAWGVRVNLGVAGAAAGAEGLVFGGPGA